MTTASEAHAATGPRKHSGIPIVTSAAYWATFSVAILLIFAFFVVTFYLMKQADRTDTTNDVWGRYVYVFGAFQAIVFAGVGWLFGREVNRGVAESAKDEAKTARADASRARKESAAAAVRIQRHLAAGHELAGAIRQHLAPVDAGSSTANASGEPRSHDAATTHLLATAERLFPSKPSPQS